MPVASPRSIAASISERASDQASPAEKPTNRQKFWAFTFAATEFLMFYPLSGGPMAAIHKASKSGPFKRALVIVYAPVIFVVKKLRTTLSPSQV